MFDQEQQKNLQQFSEKTNDLLLKFEDVSGDLNTHIEKPQQSIQPLNQEATDSDQKFYQPQIVNNSYPQQPSRQAAGMIRKTIVTEEQHFGVQQSHSQTVNNLKSNLEKKLQSVLSHKKQPSEAPIEPSTTQIVRNRINNAKPQVQGGDDVLDLHNKPYRASVQPVNITSHSTERENYHSALLGHDEMRQRSHLMNSLGEEKSDIAVNRPEPHAGPKSDGDILTMLAIFPPMFSFIPLILFSDYTEKVMWFMVALFFSCMVSMMMWYLSQVNRNMKMSQQQIIHMHDRLQHIAKSAITGS